MGKHTKNTARMKEASKEVRYPRDSPKINEELVNSLLEEGTDNPTGTGENGIGNISDMDEKYMDSLLALDVDLSSQNKHDLTKVDAQDHSRRQSSTDSVTDFSAANKKKSGEEVPLETVETTAPKKQDKNIVAQNLRYFHSMETRRSTQEQRNKRQSRRTAQGFASFINQTSSQTCSESTYDIYNSILIETEDLKQWTSAMETFACQVANNVAKHIQHIKEKNTAFLNLRRSLNLKQVYNNNNNEQNTMETVIPSTNIPSIPSIIGDMESSDSSDSQNISEDERNEFYLESDKPTHINNGQDSTDKQKRTAKSRVQKIKRATTVIPIPIGAKYEVPTSVTYRFGKRKFIKEASPPFFLMPPSYFVEHLEEDKRSSLFSKAPELSEYYRKEIAAKGSLPSTISSALSTSMPEVKKEVVDDPIEEQTVVLAETVVSNEQTSPITPSDSSANTSADSSPPASISIPDVKKKVESTNTGERKITRAQTVATCTQENLDEKHKMDEEDIGIFQPQDEEEKTYEDDIGVIPPPDDEKPLISKGQSVVPQQAIVGNTNNSPKRIDIFIPLFCPRPSPMCQLFDTMPLKTYNPGLRNVPHKKVRITLNSEYEDFLRLKKIYGDIHYPAPKELKDKMFVRVYYWVDSVHDCWIRSNTALLSDTGTTKFCLAFHKDQSLYTGDRLTLMAYVYYRRAKRISSRRVVYRFRPLGDPLAGAVMPRAAVAAAVNDGPEIITLD